MNQKKCGFIAYKSENGAFLQYYVRHKTLIFGKKVITMTIHHDKLAYGKIASLTEEFTEEKLMEMVNSLSGEEECETDKAAVSGEKDKRKHEDED